MRWNASLIVGLIIGSLCAGATAAPAQTTPGYHLVPLQAAPYLGTPKIQPAITTSGRIARDALIDGRAQRRPSPLADPLALNMTKSSAASELTKYLRSLRPHQRPKRPNGISSEQMNAAKALKPGGLQNRSFIHFDRKQGTVSYLSVQQAAEPTSPSATDAQRALRFLGEHGDLLGLKNPSADFRFHRERKDRLGLRHVQFQQTYQGIPIFHRVMNVHLRSDGSPYAISSNYVKPTADVETTPTLTSAEAVKVAEHSVSGGQLRHPSSRLVIYPVPAGSSHLAYVIDGQLQNGPGHRVVVDAGTGQVLSAHSLDEPVIASASGQDLTGKTDGFTVWYVSGTGYYMLDPTTPTPGTALDPLGVNPPSTGLTAIYDARGTGGFVTSTPLTLYYAGSTSLNSGWDPTAVSALANVEKVYSYYKTKFGRNGIGGAGADLSAVIHFGTPDASGDSDNAVWNPAANAMEFGDGGTTLTGLAGCLDVVAHEMTHGVTAATARLEYRDQSGALNESFSDVFGVLVAGSNWTVGDGCVIGGGPLRDLAHPEKHGQPARFSQYVQTTQDYGGVHTNSGIPNRAAYLIAAGLSAEGLGTSIGRDETGQIYYRALVTYLTPTSTFLDARLALAQSASDLYGAQSPEVKAVDAAFDAVEVTDTSIAKPDSIQPTSTTAPTGTDLLAYMYNSSGQWQVCLQQLDNPFTGYNPSNDACGYNGTTQAFRSPPVTFNYAGGTYILFVGTDFNVYAIDPTAAVTQITTTGNVWSIAITQDGGEFAVITNYADDNTISTGDIATGSTQTYAITAPVYDGSQNEAVQYLNSIAFDYSGKQIVFEALDCLPVPGSPCSPGASGGFQYYSLGVLNLDTGNVVYPFGNENFDYDLVNPRFAYNNNYIITFDLFDWTNYGSTNQVEGVTYIADLSSPGGASVTFAGDRGAFNTTDLGLYGHPSFFSDDKHLDIQLWDSGGTVLTQYQFAVLPNWDVDTGSGVQLNPYDTEVAVAGNTGIRPDTGTVTVDKTALDFGNVQLNKSASLNVVVTNKQNHDINIQDVAVTGSGFSDNLQPMLLPQGASVSVLVDVAPTGTFGTRSGALTVTTDGNPTTLTVDLTSLAYGIPSASNVSVTVKHNSNATGALKASTPNNDSLTYVIVSNPPHGTVSLDAGTGSFTYTPSSGFSGQDSFTYKVKDTYAESSPATVTLSVAAAPSSSGGGTSGSGGGGGGGVLGLLTFTLLLSLRFVNRRRSWA